MQKCYLSDYHMYTWKEEFLNSNADSGKDKSHKIGMIERVITKRVPTEAVRTEGVPAERVGKWKESQQSEMQNRKESQQERIPTGRAPAV